MNNYKNDSRVVLTLDAGGTNFVFSAIQGNNEIVKPVTLPSNGNNLTKCLDNIVAGFKTIIKDCSSSPSAISFAFPGPADYSNGIIGDLFNLPAFRGGIALGPFLQEKFNLPVFINNDGDLFAYGEAMAGFLPFVNKKLEEAGSPKRFKNLFGITLGTGFGAGLVVNNNLYIGDNSSAAEICLMRNKLNPVTNAEEGACIRAIKRFYSESAKISIEDSPSAKNIYEIGAGNIPGNNSAAIAAYSKLGESVGDSLAQAITLLDCLVVIGGGLSGASDLFMPSLIDEMNGKYDSSGNKQINRLVLKAYNLEDQTEFNSFLKGDKKEITIPGSTKTITYDPQKRIGVGITKLGTSKAVSIGAYIYALQKLDN